VLSSNAGAEHEHRSLEFSATLRNGQGIGADVYYPHFSWKVQTEAIQHSDGKSRILSITVGLESRGVYGNGTTYITLVSVNGNKPELLLGEAVRKLDWSIQSPQSTPFGITFDN
jgi:hypothetical protein